MRRIFAASYMMLTVLGGCATPVLRPRAVVPDEAWQGHFPLRPGDVVHLTTTIKGNPQLSSATIVDTAYPPWSETDRIPLRTARAALTPNEANLLTAFIATSAKTAQLSTTAADLESARVGLWNAFVGALILIKSSDQQPAQLQVDMGKFCEAFSNLPAAGSLGTDFFDCGEVKAAILAKAAARVATAAKPAPGPRDQDGVYLEPRRIDALGTPLGAVTASASNLQNPIYYSAGLTVAVAVARVERATTSMRNPAGDETRWNLADWQTAGICVDEGGAALRIVAVSLRGAPPRWLRILPDGSRARFRIVADPIGERTVNSDHHAPPETLSQDSLVFLSPGDLRSILWGASPKIETPLATVPLAHRVRHACTP